MSKVDKFEHYAQGELIVSLGADIVLYIDPPFTEIRESILDSADIFFNICNKDKLHWYSTDTMSYYKPTTARTFGMLSTWLKPGARPRDTFSLDLKSGERERSNPEYRYEVSGYERNTRYFKGKSNHIRALFPSGLLAQEPNRFLKVVIDLCNHVPFLSGHAGFVFERSPYHEERSYQVAYALGMRYVGVDIADIHNIPRAVKRDGVKGVNWLTILSYPFLEELGGRKAIDNLTSKNIDVIDTEYGVILKAGDKPQIGDVNRGKIPAEYRLIYDVIRPIQERTVERCIPFDLSTPDEYERTQKWYRRFAHD